MLVEILTLVLAVLAVAFAGWQGMATHKGTKATREGTVTAQLSALTEAAALALSIREKENAELRLRLAEQDREIVRLSLQIVRLEHRIEEMESHA